MESKALLNVFTGSDGTKLHYQIVVPEDYQSQAYPLILCLHGAGGRGDDNAGKGSYSLDQVPVCNEMEPAIELVDNVVQDFNADRDRTFASGQSMGGFETWDAIMRYPEKFAAAVPVCGGADPSKAPLLKNTPIWTFHGARNAVVPVSGSKDMVEALREAGGAIRYTEYPDRNHPVWGTAWNEPELIPWPFEQKKDAGSQLAGWSYVDAFVNYLVYA